MCEDCKNNNNSEKEIEFSMNYKFKWERVYCVWKLCSSTFFLIWCVNGSVSMLGMGQCCVIVDYSVWIAYLDVSMRV